MKTRIVLASNNTGKIGEFNEILKNQPIDLVPQTELGVADAEETGLSFIENALLKARHASRLTGLPAIADDSGLAVKVLHGAPGIYSARFAGTKAKAKDNIQKLLAELKGLPEEKRAACFHCVIAFMSHEFDPTPLICEGSWSGIILHETRGDDGFGYDPVFYLPDLKKTAAELPPELKNKLSHRGIALQSFIQLLPDKIK